MEYQKPPLENAFPPSDEVINDLRKLLAIHRRTLSTYLEQWATFSTAYAPPNVQASIVEARIEIRRIKNTLRDWNIDIPDHPNDEIDPSGDEARTTHRNSKPSDLSESYASRRVISALTRPRTLATAIVSVCILSVFYLLIGENRRFTTTMPLSTIMTNKEDDPTIQSLPGGTAFADAQNWVVSFSQHIEPGTWSPGEHHYSISLDCPQPYGPVEGSWTFIVSDDAELRPYTVYIRPAGIYDERLAGARISTIHPQQKTAVMVSFTSLTEVEAERRSVECRASAILDTADRIDLEVQPVNPGGSPGGGAG